MKGSFLLAVALIVVFVTVGPTSACKICTGPCTCPALPHLAPLALGALSLAQPPPPPPPPAAPPCGPPPAALELSIVGANPYAAPLYPAPAPAYPALYPPSGPLAPGYLPPGYLSPYAANYFPDYGLGLYGNPFGPPPPPPPCKYCGKKLGSGLKCKCFAKNYLYPDYC